MSAHDQRIERGVTLSQVRLWAVLGRTAESWLLMQDNYDLWKARKAVDTEELHRFDFTQVA